jgi:hypothetical protein
MQCAWRYSSALQVCNGVERRKLGFSVLMRQLSPWRFSQLTGSGKSGDSDGLAGYIAPIAHRPEHRPRSLARGASSRCRATFMKTAEGARFA